MVKLNQARLLYVKKRKKNRLIEAFNISCQFKNCKLRFKMLDLKRVR